MKHEHETDSTLLHHEACPECPSSDALAVYDDNHVHCFSCGYHTNGDTGRGDMDTANTTRQTSKTFEPVVGEHVALTKRRITDTTCRKFDYRVGKDRGGKTCHIANLYTEEGELVAQKLRYPGKEFKVLGDGKSMPLFGMHLWKRGGNKIVVTEGEIDALSVSQAQDNKWPVVSLPNGAQSAKRVLRDNLEYLESFKEVILMFDMDEAGQEAAKKAANLFTPGKVKLAKLEGGKDANDLLVNRDVRGIINAIWQARSYQPDGVVDAADLKDKVNKEIKMGLSYPWEPVTNAMYGIRSSEIITLGAGTGMGKTEFMKEIATHLLMYHKEKVGMLFLEEQNEDTILGIMGKHASIPFHIPDSVYTQEQKDEAFNAVTGNHRLYLYDSFGYTDYEIIKSRIRYMVVGCGCKYIFLDHITALVSSMEVEDERRALDSIMTSLASMVRELDFTLFMISHLASPIGTPHEEGGRVTIKQFRGSRAIGQWSSYMIGLERNQQAESDDVRGTTTLRILKDRYTGRATGFTQDFTYCNKTGRLHEKVDCPFETTAETEDRGEDY